MKKLFLLLLLVLSLVVVNGNEISAVWVLPWSISTPEDIDEMLENLSENNYNTIMAEVRYRADALYIPNKTDSTFINIESRSHVMKGSDFDALEYLLEKATSYNIDVHAWMTMMVMTPHNLEALPADHIYKDKSGWITTDAFGKKMDRYDAEGYFWDAGIPEVRDYLVNLVSDVVVNYPGLRGIHLDYIRYPSQDLGFHNDSMREFNRKGYEDNYANLMMWKEDNINTLVKAIYDRVKELDSQMILSAAVISDRFKARSNYSQNWIDWLENDYIDYVFLMSYTKKDDVIEKMLKEKKSSPYKSKIVVGLRAWNDSQKPYPVEQIFSKIQKVREYGFAGTCLFNYSGLVKHKYLDGLGMLLYKLSENAKI